MAAREFKNTFAPSVDCDVISVDEVLAGLRFGIIKESSLPSEVHDAVAAELARIKRETISPERALILLLGAMGEVRGRTRMQKYAFLVDMSMYSKKTKRLFTMYGWEPDKFGPHSQILEWCIREAIDEGLVETFPTYDPNGKTSTGYKLTSNGKERFQELHDAFGTDVELIKQLLAKFKNDLSTDPLVAYVYDAYPDYKVKSTILERFETTR